MSDTNVHTTENQQQRTWTERHLELLIAAMRKVTVSTPKGKILREPAGEETVTVQVLTNDKECLVLITGVEKTPPKNEG